MKDLIVVGNVVVGGESIEAVDARSLHTFLESRQKFADWVRTRIIENPFFAENQDFVLLHKSMKQNGRGGHNKKDYALTRDTAKKVAMAEQTEKGNEARDYFLMMEMVAKAVPVPQTLPEALRAYANEVEQKELAIAQRDEAMKTKAEIGSRREATAMATASVQAKRANKLEIELDQKKEYATIKRMQMLYHGQKFNWRLLKSTIEAMRGESEVALKIDVFDENYGTVIAYHKSVWLETYALPIYSESKKEE